MLEILSDPTASGFYDAMGATQTGEQRSTLDGQPVVEIYRLNLKSL